MTLDSFIDKYTGKYVEEKNCFSLEIISPTYGSKRFLIDKEDIEIIKDKHPYIHKNGKYFYIRINPSKEHLHRIILNPSRFFQVDHINRNTLDNRRSNLRIVTQQGNLRNQKRGNNKTGHTGVAIGWRGKYTAQIKVDYKKIHLGTFNTIADAYKARKIAEKTYWI